MDTIAGIATPLGTGGVAVIRISGGESLGIIRRIFSRKVPFEHAKMYHGHIIHNNNILDEVMAVMFYAPKSFTGEDVCEVHCHGGSVGVSLILELICDVGARTSEPGEFTKRAFLNGKIDLTQAEAISDYIFATGKSSAKASANQLKGVLREKIEEYRSTLTDILAQTFVAIEYPEEDLEEEITGDILQDLIALHTNVVKLAGTFASGKLIKNGIECVVAGKTNVGKSSLLNALCGFDRAIVSDISGTTRDTVMHTFYINGVQVNLTDTAGIRETGDEIERLGVTRSKSAMENADIILLVCDATLGLTSEDKALLKYTECTNVIYVYNKCDLVQEHSSNTLNDDELYVSAKSFVGLDALKAKIYGMLIADSLNQEILITSLRHRELLEKCGEYLKESIEGLKEERDMDCITIDLNNAHTALGEITGSNVNEEIIDRIFERFCLGK